MPTIPTYEAHAELDPDQRGMPHAEVSQASAQAGIQQGRAIQALGSSLETTLSEIGATAQKRQQQSTDFATGLQDDARRQALQSALQTGSQTMAANGTGFHDSFLQTADQISADSFAKMPPGPLRDQAMQKWTIERQGWSDKAAELQYKQEGNYSQLMLGQFGDNAQKEVAANPDAMDNIIATGHQRIMDAPGLTSLQRAQMMQNFDRTVQYTGLQTKYANDPVGLQQALGITDKKAGVPDADGQPGVGGSSPVRGNLEKAPDPVSTSARSGAAMSYFQGQGWTPAQAAGIVGNLIHESALKTGARNTGDGADGSDSIGLAQWNGNRAANLKAFAAAKGEDWKDFGTQLQFVQHELTGDHSSVGSALRQSANVRDATAAVVLGYEAPKGAETGVAENTRGWNYRLSAAQNLAGGAGQGGPPPGINPKYAALSFTDAQQLIANSQANLKKQTAQQEQEAKVDSFTVSNMVNDDVTSVQNTGQGVPNLTAERITQVLGPQKAQQWADDRARALSVYQGTAGMDLMTNDALAAHVALEAPSAADAGPGYVNKSMVYDAVQKRAQALLKQRSDDPAAAVDNMPDVVTAKQNAQSNPTASTTPMQGVINARIAQQASLGIPQGQQQPLTKAEALDIIAPVNNAPEGMDGPAMRDAIQKIENMVGPQYAPRALQFMLNQGKVDNDTAKMLSALLIKTQKGTPVTQTDIQNLNNVSAGAALRNSVFMGGDAGRRGVGSDAVFSPQTDAQPTGATAPADPTSAMGPGTASRIVPPDAAISALVQNPSKADDFDQMFGKGSAKKVLDKWHTMTGAPPNG